MNRIIRNSEVPGGNLSDFQYERVMEINREPSFNRDEKTWNFHGVLKCNTKSTPWHISVGDEYFVAVQSPPGPRGAYQVSFYPSDEKGKYTISLAGMYERIAGFVDLEAACDEFAKLEYQKKLES